jgi:hypothetical protein
MEAQNFVLVQGLRDTRATLEHWNARPGSVLWSWLAGSVIVVAALLLAVWVVALLSTPDQSGLAIAGLNHPTSSGAVGTVLFRNSLVLALHAMACVAGFIAGSSMPLEATKYSGVWRWVHNKAGPLAIGFVVCATTFSLVTQAFVLGGGAATLAAQLGIPPALLLLGLLPHALPELTVLFLPLAAWIIASRRDGWDELLAATFVTVAIAVPVLVASAFVEVYVSPHLLRALAA